MSHINQEGSGYVHQDAVEHAYRLSSSILSHYDCEWCVEFDARAFTIAETTNTYIHAKKTIVEDSSEIMKYVALA